MKNAGLTIGMVAIGLGLASIGFNLNGNQANATPAAFNAGPADPTIVWYGTSATEVAVGSNTFSNAFLFRAWADGTVEVKKVGAQSESYNQNYYWVWCDSEVCVDPQGWVVISSPNEGLNARADINFDERVDAADLGQLIAAWGDAPRNDYPPSDCPLGLTP
jgi:hypothetical protein